MSDQKDNGGPAFPKAQAGEYGGMTLRDYFAAQIAAGDAAAAEGWADAPTHLALGRARLYYRIADAMLIARDEDNNA